MIFTRPLIVFLYDPPSSPHELPTSQPSASNERHATRADVRHRSTARPRFPGAEPRPCIRLRRGVNRPFADLKEPAQLCVTSRPDTTRLPTPDNTFRIVPPPAANLAFRL